MDIGKEQKETTIEPIRVPRKTPQRTPDIQPESPERALPSAPTPEAPRPEKEPVKVPA